jgi:3-deoxy-D-manno-octulosonic-acid transferase
MSMTRALQVKDAAELETALETLLSDRDKATALGQNALKVVRENLGAIEKTVDMIIDALDGTELYIAPK